MLTHLCPKTLKTGLHLWPVISVQQRGSEPQRISLRKPSCKCSCKNIWLEPRWLVLQTQNTLECSPNPCERKSNQAATSLESQSKRERVTRQHVSSRAVTKSAMRRSNAVKILQYVAFSKQFDIQKTLTGKCRLFCLLRSLSALQYPCSWCNCKTEYLYSLQAQQSLNEDYICLLEHYDGRQTQYVVDCVKVLVETGTNVYMIIIRHISKVLVIRVFMFKMKSRKRRTRVAIIRGRGRKGVSSKPVVLACAGSSEKSRYTAKLWEWACKALVLHGASPPAGPWRNEVIRRSGKWNTFWFPAVRKLGIQRAEPVHSVLVQLRDDNKQTDRSDKDHFKNHAKQISQILSADCISLGGDTKTTPHVWTVPVMTTNENNLTAPACA